MGGGQNFRSDVPRQGRRDLLQAVAEVGAAGAANGSLAQAAEFCARTHEVPFSFVEDLDPSPGDRVDLRLGHPPSLVNGGGQIGTISSSAAEALNGCLELNWRLSGTIKSVDLANRTGRAILVGTR